ncbi:hypothetical protein RJT34_08506 [Clitoria ternatea]|uniref:Uncharacterized protein n=1 Tax=Clitoria ternatea TaxID=43366 RepID=A0AAN9K4P2_CLITE
MGGMKRSSFFMRLRKKSWKKFKLLCSTIFKWKLYWPLFFMDYVIFRIMYAFETLVLIFRLSIFYLCCGDIHEEVESHNQLLDRVARKILPPSWMEMSDLSHPLNPLLCKLLTDRELYFSKISGLKVWGHG